MDLKNILSRKLLKLFPDQSLRDEVIEILNTYGIETYEQEALRLRLAILKLSGNAPTLDEVKLKTKYAKEDFRDILTWAEYPRQSKNSVMSEGPKKQKLVDADREEYQSWLDT